MLQVCRDPFVIRLAFMSTSDKVKGVFRDFNKVYYINLFKTSERHKFRFLNERLEKD